MPATRRSRPPAFFGLGAYAGALIAEHRRADARRLDRRQRSSPPLFAALLGFAILRMHGHYFAVGSIAIVEILRLFASSWSRPHRRRRRPQRAASCRAGRTLPAASSSTPCWRRCWSAFVDDACSSTAAASASACAASARTRTPPTWSASTSTVYKVVAFALSAMYCGHSRRHLRLVGRLYRSDRRVQHPADAQGAGDGPARRRRHAARADRRRLGVRSARGDDLGRASSSTTAAILGVVIVLLIFLLPGGLLRVRWPGRRSARSCGRAGVPAGRRP